MRVKKIINKCNYYENIKVLNDVGKLIWQGYVLDLKRRYHFDIESYFILNSRVLKLRPTKIKMDNHEHTVVLEIYIKKEHKK